MSFWLWYLASRVKPPRHWHNHIFTDIELDAVSKVQTLPYHWLWYAQLLSCFCGLGWRSQTVVVEKAAAYKRQTCKSADRYGRPSWDPWPQPTNLPSESMLQKLCYLKMHVMIEITTHGVAGADTSKFSLLGPLTSCLHRANETSNWLALGNQCSVALATVN